MPEEKKHSGDSEVLPKAWLRETIRGLSEKYPAEDMFRPEARHKISALLMEYIMRGEKHAVTAVEMVKHGCFLQDCHIFAKEGIPVTVELMKEMCREFKSGMPDYKRLHPKEKQTIEALERQTEHEILRLNKMGNYEGVTIAPEIVRDMINVNNAAVESLVGEKKYGIYVRTLERTRKILERHAKPVGRLAKARKWAERKIEVYRQKRRMGH